MIVMFRGGKMYQKLELLIFFSFTFLGVFSLVFFLKKSHTFVLNTHFSDFFLFTLPVRFEGGGRGRVVVD